MKVSGLDRMSVGSPGEALLHDFLTAANDHSKLVSIVDRMEAEEERRREFGRRWRGTTILARVSEDSPAHIYRNGVTRDVDEGEGSSYTESAPFKGAVGRVKSMSPNGYITLTDKQEIDLPHGKISALELGLEIEVLDLGPIED